MSSQDDAQARQESGGGLGFPSLTPRKAEPNVPSTNVPSDTPVKPAKPLHLLIPKIKVKASVLQLGTEADGSQMVPKTFTNVSWWNEGQLPGQPGNAVFAGHTYSKGDGVFDQLPKLRKGDRITVVTQKGEQTFIVCSVGSVPTSEYGKVASQITRSTGKPGIVLQTCGDWDGSEYHATTVVFALLAP
ncbi:MAG: class F sortase [Candidatus Saccharibacteria bacterium]